MENSCYVSRLFDPAGALSHYVFPLSTYKFWYTQHQQYALWVAYSWGSNKGLPEEKARLRKVGQKSTQATPILACMWCVDKLHENFIILCNSQSTWKAPSIQVFCFNPPWASCLSIFHVWVLMCTILAICIWSCKFWVSKNGLPE